MPLLQDVPEKFRALDTPLRANPTHISQCFL